MDPFCCALTMHTSRSSGSGSVSRPRWESDQRDVAPNALRATVAQTELNGHRIALNERRPSPGPTCTPTSDRPP